MQTEKRNEAREWEHAFCAAMELYATLHNSGAVQLRWEFIKGGRVTPQPVDFCADIEYWAAQNLASDNEWRLWLLTLQSPDDYINLPVYLRIALGKVFVEFNLGVDGPYKHLYWHIKNESDRQEILNKLTEEENGIY